MTHTPTDSGEMTQQVQYKENSRAGVLADLSDGVQVCSTSEIVSFSNLGKQQYLLKYCYMNRNKFSEIVSLFHPPTIIKVLGIVGLSFRLLTCVQQMQNSSNPCR